MSPSELEAYLHERIPLSRAMHVTVVGADESAVVLRAPLAPNVNHRGTVFGGSAAALGTLAAWALLHSRLAAAGIGGHLVVRRSTIDYLAPIPGDFTARASLADADAWRGFVAALERKGKARIQAQAVLEHDGRIVAELDAEFVALGDTPLSVDRSKAPPRRPGSA